MMAKSVLASAATLFFAFAIQTANAEYEVAGYCPLVPVGTKLPSFESCQNYYICPTTGGQPINATCGNTQSFDKNSQSCKASSTVNCYYGVDNPCQNKNNAYVPNVNDCHGWIWCVNNAEKGRGVCARGQLFDSATGSCVYGQCSNADTGNGFQNVSNVCEIMQSGKYFGSSDDCAQWSICNNLNITTGQCTAGLVYNTERRMCLKNDGTMCGRTNGDEPVLPDASCNANTTGQFVGDSKVCTIGYKCEGTWEKIQCLNKQYFDVPTGTCLSRPAATPGIGCNRCQHSTSTWVNAVDYECEDYLTCKDGVEVGHGSCEPGQFFNEPRQVCDTGINDLPTYRKTNGACAPPLTTIEPTTVEEEKTTVEEEKTTAEVEKTTEKNTEEVEKTTEKNTEDVEKTTEKNTEEVEKTTEKNTEEVEKTTEKNTEEVEKTTEKTTEEVEKTTEEGAKTTVEGDKTTVEEEKTTVEEEKTPEKVEKPTE